MSYDIKCHGIPPPPPPPPSPPPTPPSLLPPLVWSQRALSSQGLAYCMRHTLRLELLLVLSIICSAILKFIRTPKQSITHVQRVTAFASW